MHDDARYRAILAQDPRFDGTFYVGVVSTGIYCRPSCPAIRPKRANVRFFRTAAQAQAQGFRACRRCRPDSTPGSPEWNIRADVTGRAMRLIADGLVDREGVAGLAARLGYSERQVHRTLARQVGAGPLRLARAQRAHTARTLLETTGTPVTEVAFAAGFGSVRQFNDTIRQVYGTTPGDLRTRAQRRRPVGSSAVIELRLAHREPAALGRLLRFLARHAVSGIEEVDQRTYRRSVALPHGPGVVELTPSSGWTDARLHLPDPRDLSAAVARCRRILDLDADPQAIDDSLALDPALRPLVAVGPGLRVPGTPDGFELAVRAVLGQRIAVAAARAATAALVATFGPTLDAPVAGITQVFPSAEVLADVDPTSLRLPLARQHTLVDLAARVAGGQIDLHAGADRDGTERALLAIPGIGSWTARYVRLRALGDPDVFLPTDDALVRSAARFGIPGATRSTELDRYARRWRPWRSYAALHLWSADTDPGRVNS